MPSTIGKCKLFSIKHITVLEGETFLRNKHEIAFFEIKCTFFGRKENTIRQLFFIKHPQIRVSCPEHQELFAAVLTVLLSFLLFFFNTGFLTVRFYIMSQASSAGDSFILFCSCLIQFSDNQVLDVNGV